MAGQQGQQGTLWPETDEPDRVQEEGGSHPHEVPECVHGVSGWGLGKKSRRKPRLLSASKRTDIPAFYLEWFSRALQRGWVDVPNPMLSGKLLRLLRVGLPGEELPPATPSGRIAFDELLARAARRVPVETASDLAQTLTHVSLKPEDVIGIVWWSKNYGPYLRRREEFAQYERQFFQFTINPRTPELSWMEPDVPPEAEALGQAVQLAELFGGGWVAWRYDPLVFWFEDGEPRSNWDEAFFRRACRVLGAAGIRSCVTSKVDRYKKFERRMKRLHPDKQLREPEPGEFEDILRRMAEIAEDARMSVETCSEAGIPGDCGVTPASCINAGKFDASKTSANDREPPSATDRKLGRDACECHMHVDIGDYATQECGYACVYCYANPNHRLLSAGSGR
ncbi:MAG: hypothetical protein KatS3mg062_0464 [Tepidiforma sp.]|nr:MAG: hypothetical protein KatS3mg062_0464 [Tepidiforma sp.]